MATAKCSAFLCMLLVLTLTMQNLAWTECSTRGGASLGLLQHRKFFMEMKSVMGMKSINGVPAFVSDGNNGLTEEELRRVPGGPDPMHHHGQGPKPRTP